MDWLGQKRAEMLMQVLLVASAVAAFLVGYVRADFQLMLLVYAVALAPAFHYLWLYAGSGNANFFYASTLVMGLANGALTMDALWAWLRIGFVRDKDMSGDAVVIQQ